LNLFRQYSPLRTIRAAVWINYFGRVDRASDIISWIAGSWDEALYFVTQFSPAFLNIREQEQLDSAPKSI
jgi:hypothetical protein